MPCLTAATFDMTWGGVFQNQPGVAIAQLPGWRQHDVLGGTGRGANAIGITVTVTDG
jgi:hypothetical protein